MQPYNGNPNYNPNPNQPASPQPGQPPVQPANYPYPQSNNYPGYNQPGNFNGNPQPPYPNNPYPNPNNAYYAPVAAPAKKGLPGFAWVLIGLVTLGVIVGLLVATGVLTGSVSFSTGEMTVKEVTLAKGFQDGKAVNPTTTFSPQDNPLHSVVTMENVKDGTQLKGVWTAIDAGGEQNFEIGSKAITATFAYQSYTAHFTIDLPQAWPVGKYKFELFINDKLEKSVNFTVQ
jgi:hypothetical protein